MSRSRASDRWADADRRLRQFLPSTAADRWWITPLADLGGTCPIVAWESGHQRKVEQFLLACVGVDRRYVA